MREWADKGELVARLAQARRDAYNTGPRMSNDELEAAMFVAMLAAVFPEVVQPQEVAEVSSSDASHGDVEVVTEEQLPAPEEPKALPAPQGLEEEKDEPTALPPRLPENTYDPPA